MQFESFILSEKYSFFLNIYSDISVTAQIFKFNDACISGTNMACYFTLLSMCQI